MEGKELVQSHWSMKLCNKTINQTITSNNWYIISHMNAAFYGCIFGSEGKQENPILIDVESFVKYSRALKI